jgi:hypothetical protein
MIWLPIGHKAARSLLALGSVIWSAGTVQDLALDKHVPSHLNLPVLTVCRGRLAAGMACG